jgi:hypothetical protein
VVEALPGSEIDGRYALERRSGADERALEPVIAVADVLDREVSTVGALTLMPVACSSASHAVSLCIQSHIQRGQARRSCR